MTLVELHKLDKLNNNTKSEFRRQFYFVYVQKTLKDIKK